MLPYFFAAGHHHYLRWIKLSRLCVNPIFQHLLPSLDEMYQHWIRQWNSTDTKKKVKDGWSWTLAQWTVLKSWWENSHPLTTETTSLHHIIDGWKGECGRCTEGWTGYIHIVFFITSWGIFCALLKQGGGQWNSRQKEWMSMGWSHVVLRHCLFGCWWWGVREEWNSLPYLITSLAWSLHPSWMIMDASKRVTSLWLSSILKSLFPIPIHQALFFPWCAAIHLPRTVVNLASSMGHQFNCPKHLSSLTSMSKSLPRTTRGREEPGRAPQSTNSH